MAFKGQRYEADDFGYPGSRHGDRDRYQGAYDDRRYGGDDRYNDVGRRSQNRNCDDDRDDRRNRDRGGRNDDRGWRDDDRRGGRGDGRGGWDDDRRGGRDDDRRGGRGDDRGGRGDDRGGRGDDRGGRGDDRRGGGRQKGDKTVVDRCMEDLRKICKARGVSGIKTMGRMFRLYDDNRSGTLSKEEFAEGLRDYGLQITKEEFRQLFDYFDTDNNGSVNYNEFLLHLRPPMSRARIDLIEKAFQKLDKTGDGFVTIDDLKHTYNVTHHPKFKSGEWTRKQVLEEYLNSFQVGPNAQRDDKVTKQEFIEYYAGVSASIDKDVYFDYMMRQAWNI